MYYTGQIIINQIKKKILKKISYKTILERVVENIRNCKKINKIIIATSKEKSDDETAKLCKKLNVTYYRGDLKNVAKRFFDILNIYKTEYFIRINADSPLIDSKLIDLILSKNNKKYDIITNVLERSFPKGQSVEIFNSNIFKKNFKNIHLKDDKENVTSFFYKNSSKFKILNIKNKVDFSSINLSVDTIDDLKIIRNIYKKTKTKNWKSYVASYQKYN